MTLRTMLDQISEYRMVVVSGPQRSGTHVMAKIIADELDWIYIPDTEYSAEHNGDWAKYVLESHNVVIHCPHMSHMLHFVPSDVAVVYMYRPIDEIEESFERVNPGEVPCCRTEQMLFYPQPPGVVGSPMGNVCAELKNNYWEAYQQIILGQRGFSFKYHDLESHPLFYKKEDRKDWLMNQTEPKGEV